MQNDRNKKTEELPENIEDTEEVVVADEETTEKELDIKATALETRDGKQIIKDWERLKRHSKMYYPPDVQDDERLDARRKLAALAHMLGWTKSKISKAAKINVGTIAMWLNESPVKQFIAEMEYHKGDKNIEEFYKSRAFKASKVIEEIMNDRSISAGMRLKAAEMMVERAIGKVADKVEVKQNILGDFMKSAATGSIKSPVDIVYEEKESNEEPESTKH